MSPIMWLLLPVVLLINLLIIVMIYTLNANQHEDVLVGFALSILHTGINLAIAVSCLLIAGIQKLLQTNTELFLSLALIFLLSTALVALLSFPACLIAGAYTNSVK